MAAGWIFVINKGGSGVGMEPAQTRWRKALMSRGVGLRGCCCCSSPPSMVGGRGGSGNIALRGGGGVLVIVVSVLERADVVESSCLSVIAVAE